MSQIYMWFVCKACCGCFLTVEDFLKHKKDQHFAEFIKTKCIVFAEQPQDQNQETDYESNNVKVADPFSNLPCESLTHHTSLTQTQAQTAIRAGSNSDKLQARIKLKVEAFSHCSQPQCEPYVLLKRLTKKQLKTVQAAQTLNQKSISNKNFPNESSPSNKIAYRSVVKCEPVIFQVNAKSSFDTNTVVNPLVKQEFTQNNDEYFEEPENIESKLTNDPQEPHCSTQFSPAASALLSFNLESQTLTINKATAEMVQSNSVSSLRNTNLSKTTGVGAQEVVKAGRGNKTSKNLGPAVRPVCHSCSKSFSNKYILNNHLRIAHSTARQFACRCGKAYKYAHDVTSHKRKQNLKKENGKRYNMICLEDYVARKKKSSKSCNSKTLERPPETFDCSVIYHSSIDNSNLTGPTVPTTTPPAELQGVIKLEMDIEPPKTQICSANMTLVPQTMAKEHQTPKRTEVIGINFRPETSLNEFITCNSNSAENSRIVALLQFKKNNDYNEGLSRGTEPKLTHDLQESHTSSQFNSTALTSAYHGSPKIQQQNSTLNLETNLARMERQVKISSGVSKANSSKKQYKHLKPDVRPVCHLCAKSFLNKYILNNHLQRHHSTIRRFRCRCGKTYKYKGDFKQHQQTHQCIKLISSVDQIL